MHGRVWGGWGFLRVPGAGRGGPETSAVGWDSRSPLPLGEGAGGEEVAAVWKDMWIVTRARFEEVLVAKWQQMSTRTPRSVFIQNFQKELKLFLEHEPFEAALRAEAQKKDIPVGVLVKLLRQHVGQQLFQAEAQHAKWHTFVNTTEERLKDLLHLDCAIAARDNFMAATKVAVKDLLSSGFAAYGKYEVSAAFFDHIYKVQVAGLHEVALVMYQLLLRQVVVNCKQVPALPWEEHLLEMTEGSIPNIPSAMRVESSVFEKMSLGREILLRAVKDCTTYEAMAREMRMARDSIRAVDPYFYLEEEFFARHVPAVVEKHIFDKVLSTLPADPLDPTDASDVIGKGEGAYKRIAAIHACAMVRHSQPGVAKAVSGAMMIVRAMLDGEALSTKAVLSSSDFHQSVYRQCASFLVFEQSAGAATLGPPRFLYGPAAMAAHIQELDKALEAMRPLDLSALKVFRQFRWLLSHADDARIQKNIIEERRKRQNFLENCMLKDGAPIEDAPRPNLASALALAPSAPDTSSKQNDDHNKDNNNTGGASSSSREAPPAASGPPGKKLKQSKFSEADLDERLSLFLPKWMAQAKAAANGKSEGQAKAKAKKK